MAAATLAQLPLCDLHFRNSTHCFIPITYAVDQTLTSLALYNAFPCVGGGDSEQ